MDTPSSPVLLQRVSSAHSNPTSLNETLSANRHLRLSAQRLRIGSDSRCTLRERRRRHGGGHHVLGDERGGTRPIAIMRARRDNPVAKIVVTGCAAQINPCRKPCPRSTACLEILKSWKRKAARPAPVLVNDIMSVRETAGHLYRA